MKSIFKANGLPDPPSESNKLAIVLALEKERIDINLL